MVDPKVLLVSVAVALTWWAGAATVAGAKKLGHVVKAGIVHVVHSHHADAPPPQEP